MTEELRWIGRALRQRATVDCNYVGMHRRRRCWYTFKAIVCIVLRREDGRSQWDRPVTEPDMVEVAYGNGFTYQHPEFLGPSAEWELLAVGHGVVRRWRFAVTNVGYP